MNSPITQLLLRWLVLALGVMLATKIVPGIRCDNGQMLIIVVLLLSFFNAILKPLLVLFTLPFILFTMGLGVVVINALLFLLVGRLVTLPVSAYAEVVRHRYGLDAALHSDAG